MKTVKISPKNAYSDEAHNKFLKAQKVNFKRCKRTDSELQVLHQMRDDLRHCARQRDEFISAEDSGLVDRSSEVMNQYIQNLDSHIRKLSYRLNNLKRGL